MSGKPKQQQKDDDAEHEKDDKANFYALKKNFNVILCCVACCWPFINTLNSLDCGMVSHRKKWKKTLLNELQWRSERKGREATKVPFSDINRGKQTVKAIHSVKRHVRIRLFFPLCNYCIYLARVHYVRQSPFDGWSFVCVRSAHNWIVLSSANCGMHTQP